jgi:hypothetical protein
METFSPYVTIEDTSVRLVVEEPKWRQRLLFFLFRILPIILTIVFFAGIANSQFSMPTVILLSIFFLIYDVVLLNIPIVIKAEVTQIAIVITTQTLFATKEDTIVINNIEKIVSRIRRGKYKALLYYVVLKDNRKRRRLLTFHRFHMSKTKRQFVGSKLQSITGLPVENL